MAVSGADASCDVGHVRRKVVKRGKTVAGVPTRMACVGDVRVGRRLRLLGRGLAIIAVRRADDVRLLAESGWLSRPRRDHLFGSCISAREIASVGGSYVPGQRQEVLRPAD